MGNFLDNVIKSREEWLKKPNPIPNRARYLTASLVTNQEPISEQTAVPNVEPNENTNAIAVQETISD